MADAKAELVKLRAQLDGVMKAVEEGHIVPRLNQQDFARVAGHAESDLYGCLALMEEKIRDDIKARIRARGDK